MSKFEKAVEILSKLISIPSPSGREEEISYYIYDYLTSIGFKPELQEVYKTGYNVLVKLGRGDKIMICGHLDTIPQLDMKEPYKPVVKDGRIYGRGACDMKGGLTSMLLTLEELSEKNIEPDVVFAFVVDEEMYGRGASELMIRNVKTKTCIILEPTSMDICIGNAGCIEFKLRVYGRSGHGASRNKDNAILNFYEVYKILEEKIEKEFTVNMEYSMKPIFNLGKLVGGYGGWVVPGEAEGEVLIHFHPEISYSRILAFLKEEISKLNARKNVKIEFEPIHGCDGFLVETEYVEMLSEIHKKILRSDPKKRIVESETDANALFHKAGIECIIYGPGDIQYAHSSEENISIKEVLDAADVLVEFLRRL
ncbi:MAG: ArgE/DapE family deacylase [Nitrososphaerota archaeon]|nr:ArgE/DapE family deacylase [Candidatus Geocrenenecus dongiae]